MRIAFLLAVFILSTINAHIPTIEEHEIYKRPLITRESIEELKKVAKFDVLEYDNHPFKEMSAYDLIYQLGLNFKGEFGPSAPYGDLTGQLPASFDSRQQWPNCIHSIRDQQNCGACWAFAATAVLSDRYCIATQGAINTVLSPQELVSCDTSNMGCHGGMVNTSWDYLQTYGVVTDSCFGYSSQQGYAPQCPFYYASTCQDGTQPQKYSAASHGQLFSIEQAKADIVNNGPIEAGFMVYQDLLQYRGGIYRRTSPYPMGGHAVRIVGYGNEYGVEYWIVANTWSTNWGEQGFFRIAFGESNIESMLWSGLPKTTSSNYYNNVFLG